MLPTSSILFVVERQMETPVYSPVNSPIKKMAPVDSSVIT